MRNALSFRLSFGDLFSSRPSTGGHVMWLKRAGQGRRGECETRTQSSTNDFNSCLLLEIHTGGKVRNFDLRSSLSPAILFDLLLADLATLNGRLAGCCVECWTLWVYMELCSTCSHENFLWDRCFSAILNSSMFLLQDMVLAL